PVYPRRADDDPQAAPQARRATARADRAGRGVPDPMRRLPRLTIRGRLTLVYGGLFFLAGLILLALTYLLMSRQLSGGQAYVTVHSQLPVSGAPSQPPVLGTDMGYVSPD